MSTKDIGSELRTISFYYRSTTLKRREVITSSKKYLSSFFPLYLTNSLSFNFFSPYYKFTKKHREQSRCFFVFPPRLSVSHITISKTLIIAIPQIP